MVRRTAQRRDDCIGPIVLDSHQGHLTQLAAHRTDRGENYHGPAAKVGAFSASGDLVQLHLLARSL
jgi:hypothetical protein